MSYRLQPHRPVHQSIRKIAVSQIEDLLAEHGKGAASPTAVHEARKALKRLRALLSLIREALDADDLQRVKQRLRDIAGSLAGARDAHVRIETATALQNGGMPRSCVPTAHAVMKVLQKRSEEADAQSAERALPVAALREAQKELDALPFDQMDLQTVLDGFMKSYRQGRKQYAEVYRGDVDDESFHELRKSVQHHWRHLQIFSESWQKALRPQIALAHELAETLGKDHDLSVLAGFVRDNADSIGHGKGLDSYLRLCAKVQERLRADAHLMARRLYAEKPKALRERMRVYWQTAGEMGKAKATRSADGKGMALRS